VATLSDLRSKVRSQTETDSSTLTDTEIDGWLQEAYNRTIAAENDWPFFEKTWTVTQTTGDVTITMPTDVKANGVVSLVDLDETSPRRLLQVPYEQAEIIFLDSSAPPLSPVQYSIWGDVIYLWPATSFAADRSYRLRGWRQPTDWIAGGASAEPDCDSRMHLALANYAIALAYIQQEDPELEQVYMMRWQKDVEMARQVIMEVAQHRPLTMGPRYITPIGTPGGYWVTPEVNAP